jgi:hypothetical protein
MVVGVNNVNYIYIGTYILFNPPKHEVFPEREVTSRVVK